MFLHRETGGRRGITVLTLLLIIIAVIIAAVFLVRYLGNRTTTSLDPRPATASIA
jgi:hypothetical protein